METHFCRHRQIREQKYEKRNKKQLKRFKMTMTPNTLKKMNSLMHCISQSIICCQLK